MTGRRNFSYRLTALFLAVVLLVTPIMRVPVHAADSGSSFADTLNNSSLISGLGKLGSSFSVVTGAISLAGSIYGGVRCAINAEDGEGVSAFFKGLLGKEENMQLEEISNTLNEVNGKIDDISEKVDELSTDLDTVLVQLDTVISKLDKGVEDITVSLYQSQLQMQQFTETYGQINSFYTKYGDVRRSLETLISDLNDTTVEHEGVLNAVSELSNGNAILSAIDKLDVACSNFESLSAEDQSLLKTSITYNGKTDTVYNFVLQYVEHVNSSLENVYKTFASDFDLNMFTMLQNMSDYILGSKWQNSQNGGIGEIYYKLAVMAYSTNTEAHIAYENFISGVLYDYLLTAYVCALSLRSQIAYGEATNSNIYDVATMKTNLSKINNMIEQVLVYTDYEYQKCITMYDFDGYVPAPGTDYDDYTVYYGNNLNALKYGYKTSVFAAKRALSMENAIIVSNQSIILSVGDSAQLKIWHDGTEIQGMYPIYTSSDCVIVNEDGTIVGLKEGTAKISLKINGVLYDVAVVSVNASFAVPNGTSTDQYVFYNGDDMYVYSISGKGYTYQYSCDVYSVSPSNGIDSSEILNPELNNYIDFGWLDDVGRNAQLSDYSIHLNHKYGKLVNNNTSIQFAHAYTGVLLLTRGTKADTRAIVIPITNKAGDKVEKSDIDYDLDDKDSDTVYIYTKEDLINWVDTYETDYTFAKKNVKLMNDIDFEWGEWSGLQYALVTKSNSDIYNRTNKKDYKVNTYTFDGNGFTIRNITFVPTVVEQLYYELKDNHGKIAGDINNSVYKTELSAKKFVTYGFFAKLAGSLENLTIENVRYKDYPAGPEYILNGWEYDYNYPRIMSVFAALGDSYLSGYKGDESTASKTDNSITSYYENSTEWKWISEIVNCVASGYTETVDSYFSIIYDPFGNYADHNIKPKYIHTVAENQAECEAHSYQHIDVKNCVYDMSFRFNRITSWSGVIIPETDWWKVSGDSVVALFDTREDDNSYNNLFSGHIETNSTIKIFGKNALALRNSTFTDVDLSASTVTEAQFKSEKFWTDSGWSQNAFNYFYHNGGLIVEPSEFKVDISGIKSVYLIGETFDTENLRVFSNGQLIKNYTVTGVDKNKSGIQTVTVEYNGHQAKFNIEYVGFVDIKFSYNGTTYTYNVKNKSSYTLPNPMFTSTEEGMVQSGWQLENSSTTYNCGETITVNGAVTFSPTWKVGKMCTVVFGTGDDAITYTVPENTTITVPYPIGYDTDSYYNGYWKCDDMVPIDDKYFDIHDESVYFGSTFVVTTDHHFDSYFRGMPKPIPFKINIYFQNLNDDDYSYMGTYSGQTSSSTIYPEYQRALSSVGITGSVYNVPRDYIDKFEAFNCGGDHSSAYGLTLIRGEEVSEITLWIRRPSHTVTWLDIDGNTISTDTVRYGVMPTAPADADAAPAGYTPVWNKTFAVVTNDVTYQVSQLIPMSGIEYTVNHMWQNINDDEYTVHESETLTGTTREDTAAVARDYTGFTVQTFTQVEIAGDGTTVVNIYYNRNEYTVTWDIEGVTTTENYHYGATPSWKGEIPVKTTDPKYNYTFVGWGDIQPVTDHATYTAQFKSELNTFVITWDIDGVTTTEVYTWGDIPEYKGETPEREATAQYTYTFAGWGDIAAVTEAKTYTATFDATVNKYTITWVVEGDSFEEEYEYGATPSYKGTKPIKPSDEAGSYAFNGWGQIETVTGDKTYTAQFISTASTYTITWDVNGEKLTELYTYGDIPSYKGVTPIKPATAQYSYTFAGWGEITEVTGNKTYTAQFTETINKYTITWNIDGNQITEEYEYGATPSYKGATPKREADAQYTYSFRDWGTILTVTGDKTYTATFDTTVNKYNITWIIDGVQFTENYDYGAMPVYKGYTPTKDANAQYTYTFAGWGEIVKVTGNKTYTAIFDSTVNKYTITWNIDGTEITEEYEYGATPSYKGETPTRAGNAQYTYTFKDFGSVLSVTGDKTYTAQFVETVNKYTVTWVINGVETTEEYEYGATPSYKGETPTKDGNAQVDYIFTGWGEIAVVTGDVTYTAQFVSSDKTYTITWVVDGQQTVEQYKYGAIPSYKGATPSKEATAQYTYTFEGWGVITEVTGDKTYTAVFSSTVNKYTITWNVDGTLTTEEYEYGATPSYKGATPSKAATAQYTYTFKDWGTITEVTGDKTYTANFTSTVNRYTITWVVDGEQFNEEYEYGATPVYKGYKPTKPATAQYTYTFAGWGEITKVTGDKTYTAAFEKTVNKYTITWDVDGVKTTEVYEYGATPSYKGETPEREADAENTYTFIGWGQIEAVTGNKTYTAQFTETVNAYTITWNINGEETTESYPYGATPSYKGETPVKQATAQYTYTFAGWGEITKVTGDKTYTAVFSSTVNKYTITWNIDGNKTTEEYEYGATPSYKGATPSKEATAQYTYAFRGWGEIEKVTGNKTYTAMFSSTVNKYTITWNIDGNKTTEEYEYGATPSYKGATPSKEATAQYTYTFEGWGVITEVTGNKTYTAVFSSTVNKYTITWNVDGTLTTEEYEYGATPSYKGATPSKAATAQYTYTFKDWGTITEVTGDKTYTANFTSTVNRYTITWVVDGEQFTEEYEYGATPVYKGYKPTKPATAQYTYEFSGWGEITKVTGNKTYTAIFDATYIVPDEITSSTYNVGEDTISKIVANTSSKEFIAAINESKYCKVFKGDSVVSDDTAVGTGMTVDIVDGDKTTASYTIIVTGDTNGDGNITITDMLAIKAHVLGKTELTGAYAVAADTNGDGAITITDFLQLKAQLLGKGDIEAR